MKAIKKGIVINYCGKRAMVRNMHKDKTVTIVDFFTEKYIARIPLKELEAEDVKD